MLRFLERNSIALSILLILLASGRIALTWNVFNATVDEGNHIACGMEWLELKTYQFEPQHPPLARVAAAIGLYLEGVQIHEKAELSEVGKTLLLTDGKLDRNLALARAGELPFFWIACAVVFIWARKAIGSAGAVLALLIFTYVPPILAHSGLATTDIALTAMLGAAVLAAIFWFENPTTTNALILGITVGLALIAKFSAIPFLICAAGSILVCRVMMRRFPALNRSVATSLCLAVSIACFVVWAAYRFSVGPVAYLKTALPAPEFFSGIQAVHQYNEVGHLGYLFGRESLFGFWDYYLVDLIVKTPLALLILTGIGIVVFARSPRSRHGLGDALLFSSGILAFAVVYSRINIGIRHILPIYIGLSILAAGGLIELLRLRRGKWFGAALIVWLVATTSVAHPDYLPYFNMLAAGHPEKIVIDSDLDWGQDMKRLGQRLHELHVDDVGFLPLVYPELSSVPFPSIHPMDIEHALPGWYAANITALKLREHDIRLANPRAEFWPDSVEPTEKIGGGILLWKLGDVKGVTP